MRRFTILSAAFSAAIGSFAYLADASREVAIAIAEVSAASPSANPSAPISRAQIVNKPAGSSPAGDGAILSRALRHREAGAAAQSGLDLASQAAPRSSAFEQMTPELRVPGLERVPSAGRPMARAQGMRPGRPPLGRESKQGGVRSLLTMADAAATLCGVEAQLFRDLIARESSWQEDAISAAGAIGLAQVMPQSARHVSPTLDVRDPWQNLVAGACLLRQYHDRFGSWRLALHAYHGGPTRVDQRRTTKQSRDYARDVIEGSAQ